MIIHTLLHINFAILSILHFILLSLKTLIIYYTFILYTHTQLGWKMIHGDVFRGPSKVGIFASFLGAGAQIFSTILILLICVIIGVFKATRRGALLTALIVIYALCGLAGGFISSRVFKQLKGKNWVWNVVMTAGVFPVPLGVVFSWVNAVAWARSSTAALPFTTIMVSLAACIYVCIVKCVYMTVRNIYCISSVCIHRSYSYYLLSVYIRS